MAHSDARGVVKQPRLDQQDDLPRDMEPEVSQHSARDRRWMKLRAQKLKADPICEHNSEWQGVTERCGDKATTVHHIKPQSTHPELRYEWTNLMSLCEKHGMAVHGKKPKPETDPKTGLPISGHWWSEV